MVAKETLRREHQQRLAQERAAYAKEQLWRQLLTRFTHLTQHFHTYLGDQIQHPQDKRAVPLHEGSDSFLLGQRIAEKLNADINTQGVQTTGKTALEFVERAWLEGALYDLPTSDTATTISAFLDTCDDRIQSYCEEEPAGENMTRLQMIRGKLRIPSK